MAAQTCRLSGDLPPALATSLPKVPANSATRALNIIGDRWILMILHLAFSGVRRFDDFQGRIGLARSLLTDRLRRLETAGIMTRERYCDRPARYEYRLSPAGKDLLGVALMIVRWEKRWFYDETNPYHRLRHSCGADFIPEFRCGCCHEAVTARDVTVEDGPGIGFDPLPPPRVQRRAGIKGMTLACSEAMLERALLVLGDRWASHVIAACFRGRRRFNDFLTSLMIAPNILSDRLNRLTAIGVLSREFYRTRPQRLEYRLTDLGRDLYPLMVELIGWGDRWLAGPSGPPMITYHRRCGQPLVSEITCSQCGQTVERRSVGLPALSQPGTITAASGDGA